MLKVFDGGGMGDSSTRLCADSQVYSLSSPCHRSLQIAMSFPVGMGQTVDWGMMPLS